MKLPFVKMHGAGNDYVYVDAFAHPVEEAPALAVRVADRRTGVGGDGLILIEPSERAEARMRIFNADGSEAETCGNGLRCVAKFLFDRGRIPERATLETGAGLVEAEVVEQHEGRARTLAVDMGRPRWSRQEIPMRGSGVAVDEPLELAGRALRITALGLGNPHCVVFVEDLEHYPVEEVGTALQASPLFPASVNVEFVEPRPDGSLDQRTYERGSGETWACGSGAVAAAVAAQELGRARSPVTVHLRGGSLVIHHAGGDAPAIMEGPAVQVFEGVWED